MIRLTINLIMGNFQYEAKYGITLQGRVCASNLLPIFMNFLKNFYSISDIYSCCKLGSKAQLVDDSDQTVHFLYKYGKQLYLPQAVYKNKKNKIWKRTKSMTLVSYSYNVDTTFLKNFLTISIHELLLTINASMKCIESHKIAHSPFPIPTGTR